jgi:heat shock protein HtpX
MRSLQSKATDWREDLRINTHKTGFVIVVFMFLYMMVGFIADLCLYMQFYAMTQTTDMPSLQVTAKRIATLHEFPYATLSMLGVAGVSLLIVYYFHQKMVMLGTDYHEVTSDSTILSERQLYNVIEELKIAAGMRFMPKVYIIEADYMNAFASGFTEKSAMVAITRGLIENLDRSELQAVMAHELSHIRHNDIRLSLTVLALSNIMLIVIDILFRGVLYGQSRKGNNGFVVVILVIRFMLPIITLLLMLYLSRTRELMADTGSVELTRDNEPLGRALIKIHENTLINYDKCKTAYIKTPNEGIRHASYFYDPLYANIKSFSSLNSMFSTHPPLNARLKALGIEYRVHNDGT